jgi:hypothetical protein
MMTENIGHRKWSKKMLSLGVPTLKKIKNMILTFN